MLDDTANIVTALLHRLRDKRLNVPSATALARAMLFISIPNTNLEGGLKVGSSDKNLFESTSTSLEGLKTSVFCNVCIIY